MCRWSGAVIFVFGDRTEIVVEGSEDRSDGEHPGGHLSRFDPLECSDASVAVLDEFLLRQACLFTQFEDSSPKAGCLMNSLLLESPAIYLPERGLSTTFSRLLPVIYTS